MTVRQSSISTDEPLFALDHANRVISWNRACEDLFGVEAKDVLGKPCTFPLSVTSADDDQQVLYFSVRVGNAGARNVLLQLTTRELEILRCLAQGIQTREIALSLSIALPTVRNHVQSILQKLNVRTRFAAVGVAYRHGLMDHG